MNHGSLFSGIGGFDLAAEWMGWENTFHCEWNEFGRKVLKYYWPKAISYEDITQTDFTIWRGRIDLLTGGFPCQPYSQAGKRLGKEDERHLWPEMLRAIQEIEPTWVVGENVRGLVNWNGGMVFDEVQTDLEAEGYEVQPFLLPAAAVNAPHRRDRIWFVAKYTKCKPDVGNRRKKSQRNGLDLEGNELVQSRRQQGSNNPKPSSKDATKSTCKRCNDRSHNWQERQICDNKNRNAEKDKSERNGWEFRACSFGEIGNATNTNGKLPQGRRNKKRQETTKRHISAPFCRNTWENFPTQSPICNGDDGLSSRLDGITFPKWRNESIKAGGNAIVPQVALQIFKAIHQYELLNKDKKS